MHTGIDSAPIACIGDSITAGSPGISYIRYQKSGRCRNYGRGGDTVTEELALPPDEALRQRIPPETGIRT